MNYNWSWSVFLDMSPDGVHTFLETLLIGVGWTLALSLIAWVFSLLLGSCLGVMRTASSRALNFAGAAYVEVFRNIPLLVQMFLWYFVLPELLPHAWGVAMKQMPQPWGQFLPAVLCLGFYGSSRVAEQVRAGIQSLPRGQLQAGIAQGLTEAQVYRYIILPQAYRIVLPPLTSEFMGTIKYSSVALTIGLLELTGQARSMQEFSFHIFEAFSAATAVYLILNGVVVLGMRMLERRVAIPGLIGPAGKSR
ncbi:amino acid ABC transporter permease [Achromobacter sp. AONIH1]|uniref:amino acid ABC transporter permease n=1 Tax=Achromobacter sp. AONIH1 TaxID=1758194 RepID=UPI000CD19ED0|nr:amino acid ABC transporter permease [Achromobacter sp. AONIH1]AUT45409.1 glutamate ABC transporter permease [Achromobacter sp. AONIH1]